MSFQGSLSELPLPDVVQLVSSSGKTGCFHLTDGDIKGQIYIHEGKIVHAQVEDLSGEEAVYQLAIWSKGEFFFETGASVAANTITKTNTNLLMEAARRLDEWRVLQKKVPSMDLVPEFVIPEGREGQINLNTSEWLILSKIDGRRSIKAIANASSHSTFDACKILYGLIATNLIRLKEPAAAPAPPRPPSPAPAATGTGPTARPATASLPRQATIPPGSMPQASLEFIQRLLRIRDTAVALLGAGGEAVVQKHVIAARLAIERGAGVEVVEQAIQQIAAAAAVIKGPQATDIVLERLRATK
ncbi:MAG: DUF4388 domain-containing protein [Vicinamibacteria bacterium]|nr:DUF4388 domain-containing protein [Vicinamibacteria bacterium]